MKLKNIKSLSHNFSYSFISFDNYVDGEYVFKYLKNLAYCSKDKSISVYWIGPENKKVPEYSSRINKSIDPTFRTKICEKFI